MTISSTQKTARARAIDPARCDFWSTDGALIIRQVSSDLNKRTNFLIASGEAYFEIMLPGRAMLNVCDLPPVGVKTAVGFDVNTSPLLSGSWVVFRFYEGHQFHPYTISWSEWRMTYLGIRLFHFFFFFFLAAMSILGNNSVSLVGAIRWTFFFFFFCLSYLIVIIMWTNFEVCGRAPASLAGPRVG